MFGGKLMRELSRRYGRGRGGGKVDMNSVPSSKCLLSMLALDGVVYDVLLKDPTKELHCVKPQVKVGKNDARAVFWTRSIGPMLDILARDGATSFVVTLLDDEGGKPKMLLGESEVGEGSSAG